MPDNSNQPAFPHYSKVFEVSQTPGFQKNYKQITSFETEGGLTKREYFAGLAMQGLLCNSSVTLAGISVTDKAKSAIAHADELLYELSKIK